MSTFTIPNSVGQIRTSDRSDTVGEIIETFNLDLNTPFGKIKPSKQLTAVLTADELGASQEIYGFGIYKTRYYLATADNVFRCSVSDDPTDSSNWTVVTGINTSGFGDETDVVSFNDLLLFSLDDDILSWNGSADDDNWWTTVAKGGETGPALTANYPHTMHVHHGGQETLFVTNKNKVHYANTTAGHSTVTLGTGLVACCVDSGVNAIWVGTYTEDDNNAYVYEMYVGEELNSVPVARNAYKIDARAVLSLRVLNNVPYIVTEKGNIQAFNGSGFVTVAQLPFAGYEDTLASARVGDINDQNTVRPIHPKGMQSDNDSLFIFIDSTLYDEADQDPIAKNTPSGVWEFNMVTGQVHHRAALSMSNTKNGAKKALRSGPIMLPDSPYTKFLVGATIDSTNDAALFADGTKQYGYFTTTEIVSETVQDAYEALYAKISGSGSIEVKFRTEKKDHQYADFTFLNETELNTTGTIDAEVGDEVYFIDGSAYGVTASILEITTGSSVTSIKLDTAVGTAGESGTVEITNYKDIGDSLTGGDYLSYGSDTVNSWIQYKVILSNNIELRHLISKGTAKTKI